MENNKFKQDIVYQFTYEEKVYYVYNNSRYFFIKKDKVIECDNKFNYEKIKEIQEASYDDSLKILSYIRISNIDNYHIVKYKGKYYYCHIFYDLYKERHYSFVSIDKYLTPICDININHVFTEICKETREEQLMLYNLFLLAKNGGFNDDYLPKPNTWYHITFMENNVMHRWISYQMNNEPIINAKYLNVKDEDNNNKLILIKDIISISKK